MGKRAREGPVSQEDRGEGVTAVEISLVVYCNFGRTTPAGWQPTQYGCGK